LAEEAQKSIYYVMTNRCEDVARGFIPSNEMRGPQTAQLLGEWPEIEEQSALKRKCRLLQVLE
jgi:hypothetical protein